MNAVDNGRRNALFSIAGFAAVATLGRNAHAQDLPHVDEADATAAALGYKHDTTQVDGSRFAKHTAEQKCATCTLIQGKPGDPWRPCGIFPGKAVNADGWCAAYVLKA